MDVAKKPALSVASHGPRKPNFTGVFKTDLAMQERFPSFCSRG